MSLSQSPGRIGSDHVEFHPRQAVQRSGSNGSDTSRSDLCERLLDREDTCPSSAAHSQRSRVNSSRGNLKDFDKERGQRRFVAQLPGVLFNKVLRFWQKGQRSSPQLVRISSGLLFGGSLVVKGDALIHGPTLVARPVGSEWRTRHLHQKNIQTN
jgi:hypothetical protein